MCHGYKSGEECVGSVTGSLGGAEFVMHVLPVTNSLLVFVT
jgi:hypothetical protein